MVGTDPGVGKTILAAAIVRRLRALDHEAIGMKPIETACAYGSDHDLVGVDGVLLHAAVHRGAPPLVVSPYRSAAVGEPMVALGRAGIELRLDDLVQAVETAAEFGDPVVVEGAGGALSPLTRDGTTLDLAERLDATVLIAAPDALGVQSRALLVLEALRHHGLRIAGIALIRQTSDPDALDLLDNARVIRERGGAEVFEPLGWIEGGALQRIEAAEAHLARNRVAESILAALDRP